MAFVSEPNESTYDSLWARCAFDLPRLQRALGDSWALLKTYTLDRARTPQSGQAQHALMEAFGLMPMAEAELARITVPTALIWGRHDLATPVAVAEAVSNRYDWPLQVIEHAGDDPPMEQPETFVRVLRQVLAVRAERSA